MVHQVKAGVAGWKWADAPDATAVGGARLSVLLSGAGKQGPFYTSTKSLAAVVHTQRVRSVT